MKFSKYHGAANDFFLVDGREHPERDWPLLAAAMCDRYTGAGADGLLVASASTTAAVKMRLFNADGSEAEMSGNGVRCFAKFAIEEGIAQAEAGRLRIETGAGIITLDLLIERG